MRKLLTILVAGCLLAGACDSGGPASDADADGDVDGDSDGDGDAGGDADADGDVDGDGDGDGDPDADVAPVTVTITSVEPNPNSTLSALVTVATSEECRVAIELETAGVDPWRTGRTAPGESHEITVVGMRSESTYTFRAVAFAGETEVGTSDPEEFTTGGLPAEIRPVEVIVHEPTLVQPGFTIIAPYRNLEAEETLSYYAVDVEGEVVWYYQVTLSGKRTSGHATLLPDGNILLAVMDGLRIITIGGDTVSEANAGSIAGVGGFHHEGIQLPSGRLMTLTMEVREIDVPALGGTVIVQGDRILELEPTGELVWQWSTFDHLDPTRFPTTLSRTPNARGAYGYTHGNALVYLEAEDALLFSSRHQHWIVKIDRRTGDVIWRLGPEGDFTLVDEDPASRITWFYGQHAPELQADGSLLIYDNGNDRPGADPLYSRGAQYRIDETTMEAELVWQYDVGFYTSSIGDADRLDNGNVLLCAGGPDDRLVDRARVIEVTGDPVPTRVWELSVSDGVMYRAARIASFYVED